MGDILEFPKKESSVIDERAFSPELVKEYKATIMMTLAYQDELSVEDWKMVFAMMLQYNNVLMIELSKYLEE